MLDSSVIANEIKDILAPIGDVRSLFVASSSQELAVLSVIQKILNNDSSDCVSQLLDSLYVSHLNRLKDGSPSTELLLEAAQV